jgi:hypothetical protein
MKRIETSKRRDGADYDVDLDKTIAVCGAGEIQSQDTRQRHLAFTTGRPGGHKPGRDLAALRRPLAER